MGKNSTRFSVNSFGSNNKKIVKEELYSEDVPGNAVITNILNYSKALWIKKNRLTGLVAVILN